MGTVEFDAVESRQIAADRCCDERLDDLFHLGGRQRARPVLGIAGGRDGGCADELSGGTASRVVQLDDRHTALRADPRRQPGEARKMLVPEAPQLPLEPFTARLDVARTGHRHAEPARGAHRQPPLLVIGERPVGIALLIGQGRQHESVLHGRSVGEGDDVERCGHGRLLGAYRVVGDI